MLAHLLLSGVLLCHGEGDTRRWRPLGGGACDEGDPGSCSVVPKSGKENIQCKVVQKPVDVPMDKESGV